MQYTSFFGDISEGPDVPWASPEHFQLEEERWQLVHIRPKFTDKVKTKIATQKKKEMWILEFADKASET